MVWPIRQRQGLRTACGLAAATQAFTYTDSEKSMRVADSVIPSPMLRAGSEAKPKDLATERKVSLARRPDPLLRSG